MLKFLDLPIGEADGSGALGDFDGARGGCVDQLLPRFTHKVRLSSFLFVDVTFGQPSLRPKFPLFNWSPNKWSGFRSFSCSSLEGRHALFIPENLRVL